MTGFKSGASDDDPLSNDDSDTEPDTTRASEATETQSSTLSSNDPDLDTTQAQSSNPPSELPWIFDRSSITDGREKTVQLHLQESTLDTQRQTKSDIESELGETVKKADLREAALIVGLQQMEDLSAILKEWGYGR
jgi:hypothetical protein